PSAIPPAGPRVIDEVGLADDADADEAPVEATLEPEAGPEPEPLYDPQDPPYIQPEPTPQSWHASQPEQHPGPAPAACSPPASTAARDSAPAWHTGDSAAFSPLNPAPAGRERLELAIAYLDLGDAETARTLLREVLAGQDPAARDEAAQLLREIG